MFTAQISSKSLKRQFFLLFLITSILLSFSSCKKDAIIVQPNIEKQKQLQSGMKKLWSDHMHWTLSTVDAFLNDNSNLNSSLTRLLQNQKDIGAAIVPYYGQEAGDQLAELMTEHINLAIPVLTAAKNSDEAALNIAVANWYQNAEDIANFLTAANPNNWPKTATQPALKHHIDHTVDYSVKILTGDYEGANASFEIALEHMLMLADILSDGIIQQFPDKF